MFRLILNGLIALALTGLSIAPVQASRIMKPNQTSFLKGVEPGVPASGGPTVTWNPSDKSTYITLSGSDLVMTGVDFNSVHGARATEYKTSGKWCFYAKYTSAGVSTIFFVGVANEVDSVGTFYFPGQSNTNGAGIVVGDFTSPPFYYGGYIADITSLGTLTSTDWVGVCFDADADKIWFSKNGTWVGDPAAGTGGQSTSALTRYYPYVGVFRDDTATAHFSATSPPYSPPSGFSMIGG